VTSVLLVVLLACFSPWCLVYSAPLLPFLLLLLRNTEEEEEEEEEDEKSLESKWLRNARAMQSPTNKTGV